jgi:hypothetical protein
MQRIHVFDHVGWCLGGRLSAVVTVTVVAAYRVAVRAMPRDAAERRRLHAGCSGWRTGIELGLGCQEDASTPGATISRSGSARQYKLAVARGVALFIRAE